MMSQLLARFLREEIALQPDVEVVGEGDTGRAALREIASAQPDVVFLDLQMPEMGGFEVIRELRGGAHLPVIIVVTAYDQYAIRAFEEGAIDYLLKPVGQSRFVQALDRARKVLGSRVVAAENLAGLQEIATSAGPSAPQPRKIVGRAPVILLSRSEIRTSKVTVSIFLAAPV